MNAPTKPYDQAAYEAELEKRCGRAASAFRGKAVKAAPGLRRKLSMKPPEFDEQLEARRFMQRLVDPTVDE